MLTGNERVARCGSFPTRQTVKTFEKDKTVDQARRSTFQEAVIVTEPGGKIIQVNSEAERVFQVEAGRMRGMCLSHIVACNGEGGSQSNDLWESIPEATEFSEAFHFTRQLICRRMDGTLFDASATLTRMHVNQQALLSVVLRPQLEAQESEVTIPVLRSVATQAANEIEKRRISKQLYDDLGQELSVLKLDLDWLESSLNQDALVCSRRVAQMQTLLDHIIQNTKTIASSLRPPLLDDLGLLPAIFWMAKNFQKKTAVSCQVDAEKFNGNLDDPIKSVVFRIVQESLHNVEQHAQAETVQIRLKRSSSKLEIDIRDDGVGMAQGSLTKPDCLGLVAMRERIQALGGNMHLQEAFPHGLTLQVLIPLTSLSLDF